ncbi:MAG: hypothetical protein KDC87_07305, partial [Planctomycetes bacterium]|nr:hypothetical protein [Planctomycetota bacterium]
LSAREVELMQPVTLRLWVYTAGEVRDALQYVPAVPPGFAGEVATAVSRSGKGWMHRFDMQLRPIAPGEQKIAPFRITHGGETVTTQELTVQVASVLGAGQDAATAEAPAAPFPPQPRRWPWIAGLGALLLVLMVVWWLRRRPKRRRALPVEVPPEPHVVALRALERLRQGPRATPEEVEVFYVQVSQVVRNYLEARFGLHAPLRSTEEFLAEVERGDALTTAHRQGLRVFLQQCDLVKFARLLPGSDVHEQSLRSAEQFVQETRADAAPRPALEMSAGGSR